MPFLGQDWRAPGEQWVKTQEGWERLSLWRLKLLENLNENVVARLMKMSWWDADLVTFQRERAETCSHLHIITVRNPTKEHRIQMSMDEAFNRLDIHGAIKDIRRFNYVIKVLDILITHKLPTLSGAAQRLVLATLEDTLQHVSKTHNDMHVLRELLLRFKNSLTEAHYNHVGSAKLWQSHVLAVDRMLAKLNSVQIKQRADDGGLMLEDLPEDCVREILLRLPDHEDLQRAGLSTPRAAHLAQEGALWRAMCAFHFSEGQLARALPSGTDLDTVDWQRTYYTLVRRHGKRETYADMLHLCRHCSQLFWHQPGHRCLFPNLAPHTMAVSPAMCVNLFA